MIKNSLIIPAIILVLLTACDENEKFCSGYLSSKVPDFTYQTVSLHITEETRAPCQEYAVDKVEELNLRELSKKETTSKDQDACYPTTIYEHELKSIEQKFFTNKESLSLEEIENHIKDVCKEKINFLVFNEIRNIEIKDNQIQFEYGFDDRTFNGEVHTQTDSRFICPVYTISCFNKVRNEW